MVQRVSTSMLILLRYMRISGMRPGNPSWRREKGVVKCVLECVQTHTQSGKYLPIDDGVSTHESVLVRTALCALLLPILLFCVRFRRSDILPKVELSLASGISLLCRHHVLCKLMTRVTQVMTRADTDTDKW